MAKHAGTWMFAYHGSAALCDLFLLACSAKFFKGRLSIDMQILCLLCILVNGFGYFAYRYYWPAASLQRGHDQPNFSPVRQASFWTAMISTLCAIYFVALLFAGLNIILEKVLHERLRKNKQRNRNGGQ